MACNSRPYFEGWDKLREETLARENALGVVPQDTKVASDTLVFDLQFRLRCRQCNRPGGFRIAIFHERTRGDNLKPRLERIVVVGE